MDRAVAALQDLTRRDILYRFYSEPAPKTVVEVARAANIHRSVAFDHLERLVSLGYLVAERRRGFPGKPAKLYRLAQGPITVSHPPRQFGLLARELAVALQQFGPAGIGAARSAGLRVGAGLRLPVGSAPPISSGLAAAIRPLEVLGGRYEISEEGVVTATDCLFREACVGGEIVCHFHAGVLEGVLGAATGDRRVEPSGGQGRTGCRFRILPAQAAEKTLAG